MSIEIQVEKTINVNGQKEVSLKITGMKERYQLPEEYTSKTPAVWYFDHGLMVMDDANIKEPRRIHPRDLSEMAPDAAEKLIQHIQLSGDRLAQINKRIRRERAMYAGSEKIII